MTPRLAPTVTLPPPHLKSDIVRLTPSSLCFDSSRQMSLGLHCDARTGSLRATTSPTRHATFRSPGIKLRTWPAGPSRRSGRVDSAYAAGRSCTCRAGPAFGDKEGARVRGHETSRGIKARPRIGRPPTGCPCPQARESGSVGLIDRGTGRPTRRRAPQVAKLGSQPILAKRPLAGRKRGGDPSRPHAVARARRRRKACFGPTVTTTGGSTSPRASQWRIRGALLSPRRDSLSCSREHAATSTAS